MQHIMHTLADGGPLIRKARKAAGYTQAALAQRVGISRSTLSRIEGGMIDEIGIRKYMHVCDALGLTLTVTPKPPPPTLTEINEQIRLQNAAAARASDAIIAALHARTS